MSDTAENSDEKFHLFNRVAQQVITASSEKMFKRVVHTLDWRLQCEAFAVTGKE